MNKIIFLGFLLRLIGLLLSYFITNYDLNSYYIVGRLTFYQKNIYPEVSNLHHPYLPLFLYLQSFIYFLTNNNFLFNFLIKLIINIFDLLNIYLIFLISNKNIKKAFYYAINPVSFLVFSIHGQFDAIPLFFILLSIYFLKIKKEFAAIFSYVFAILVKTWPLIFLIIFLKKIKNKKILFLVLLISILFVLIIYSFFFKSSFLRILKTIFFYQGLWGVWGITLFLQNLRYRWQKLITFIFVSIFLFKSFILNKKNIVREIYIMLIFFIIFTTNFSIQYFSWLTPFLIIEDFKNKKQLFFISLFLLLNYSLWFNFKIPIFFTNIFGLFLLISFLKLYLYKK